MSDDRSVRGFIKFVTPIFAVLGWLWFFSMLWLKLSGATIYATTVPGVIEHIDPQWDEIAQKPFGNLKGVHFTIKIQGNQPE